MLVQQSQKDLSAAELPFNVLMCVATLLGRVLGAVWYQRSLFQQRCRTRRAWAWRVYCSCAYNQLGSAGRAHVSAHGRLEVHLSWDDDHRSALSHPCLILQRAPWACFPRVIWYLVGQLAQGRTSPPAWERALQSSMGKGVDSWRVTRKWGH